MFRKHATVRQLPKIPPLTNIPFLHSFLIQSTTEHPIPLSSSHKTTKIASLSKAQARSMLKS